MYYGSCYTFIHVAQMRLLVLLMSEVLLCVASLSLSLCVAPPPLSLFHCVPLSLSLSVSFTLDVLRMASPVL